MSIIERDIKLLRKTVSKPFRLAVLIFLPLIIAFLLVVAGLNFRLCHRFAAMAGLTVSEVFSKWTAGINVSEQYSGTLLMAIQRLQTALTLVAMAILTGLILWARHSANKRNARILDFIEKHKI